MMARMKELEGENACLKMMYIEEKLNAEILNEAITKKWRGHLAGVRCPNRQYLSSKYRSNWPAPSLARARPATACGQ